MSTEKPPTNLYTALLAAQREMGPVKKDASNPAFRTKYATLQSVLETIDGPLNDNGLVLLQRFDVGEGVPVLITEIVHAASGDRLASAVPVASKDPTDPQKMGGAITYYRRYSLLALLGLAPEDDDGHAASQPRTQPAPARNAAPAFATPRPAPAPAMADPPAPSAGIAAVRSSASSTTPQAAEYDEDLTWTDLWSWARPRGFRSKAEVATALGKPDSVVNDWSPAQIRTALEVHIDRVNRRIAGGAPIAG
jgi:hypothetical protein